jgi:hypothetical protein
MTRMIRNIAIAMMCTTASAPAVAQIPFAGDRPQSFAFYDVKPGESYDTVGQYVQSNNDSRAFDSRGNKVDGLGGHTFVGLTQPLHRGKTESGLNWFITGVLPEISLQQPGFAVSGLGDPLVGGGMFLNPDAATNVGFLALVQVPVGSANISTHTWSVWPSVFYDSWFGKVNVDGHVGAIIRQTEYGNGNNVNPGNTVHANLRAGYSLLDLTWKDAWYPIPYVALDYQKTGKTIGNNGVDPLGTQVPGPDSNETTLGVGVLFQLKQKKFYDQLTVHYSRTVSGKNTSLTNGLFIQYFHYW